MDGPAEAWGPIEEAPGYQVSSLGRVMGRRGKPLTQIVNQFGYKTVSPYVGGKTLYRQAHRLVAQAFIPNPDGLPLVNHIDGDRLNNVVSNLEWVTARQNAERVVKPAEESARRSRKVVQTFPDGHSEIWNSMKEAAEEAGICSATMVSSYCRTGRTCPGGSRWAYVEDTAPAPEDERWALAQGIEISSHGRIRLKSGQVVAGRMRGNYLRYQSHGVHRLVAEAFCGRPPGSDVVNHKNGDPADNRASNLEWLTQQQNCAHAVATGLSRRYSVQRTAPNGETTDYPSIQEASRQTHISAGDICWACKGHKARAGGSQWKYLGDPMPAAAPDGEPPHEETKNTNAAPGGDAVHEEPKITDADLDALLATLGL
jgi:hypothetical protein